MGLVTFRITTMYYSVGTRMRDEINFLRRNSLFVNMIQFMTLRRRGHVDRIEVESILLK